MITPHKYFQHPHHSSKIHGTHYFTSYQQGRSAAPLHSVQPYNPITRDFGGFAWKCPHAPQDAPAKLHIKAQWIMMWCCTLNNGYVRSSDQLPFFFLIHPRLIREEQPFSLEAPFRSCLGHTEIRLMYCTLQVLGTQAAAENTNKQHFTPRAHSMSTRPQAARTGIDLQSL